VSASLLARILQVEGKLGIETRELFERSLAIDLKNFGLEGLNTAASNNNIGNFYHQQAEASLSARIRKEHLSLSLSKLKEALRIFTKLYCPSHFNIMKASSQ
jgi:hypothetical protein